MVLAPAGGPLDFENLSPNAAVFSKIGYNNRIS